MTDKISPSSRSKNMAAIGSKNTKPEIAVRKALYALGYRYRLNKKDLPGKPDIFIPKLKLAIFVHGCFWHMHKNCVDGHIPKTQPRYWQEKLQKNVERDSQHLVKLKDIGISSLVVWECEVKANDIQSNLNLLMRLINVYEKAD